MRGSLRRSRRRRTVTTAVARRWGRLRRVSRRAALRRIAHLLRLRWVAGRASVDGREGTVWTAGSVTRRKASGRRICVRGRAPERILRVHGGGQRRRAAVGGLRGEAVRALRGRRGALRGGRWVVTGSASRAHELVEASFHGRHMGRRRARGEGQVGCECYACGWRTGRRAESRLCRIGTAICEASSLKAILAGGAGAQLRLVEPGLPQRTPERCVSHGLLVLLCGRRAGGSSLRRLGALRYRGSGVSTWGAASSWALSARTSAPQVTSAKLLPSQVLRIVIHSWGTT
jgi:hypothetical protein